MKPRPVDKVPIAEMVRNKVWEFSLDGEPGQDETWISPVDSAGLPVRDLSNRIVATEVILANGQKVQAMLGGIDLANARRTRQFVGISLDHAGKRFHLARYYEPWFQMNGPQQLADFLGLSVDQVFPISYDISGMAIGLPEVLVGQIPAGPEEKLTDAERMELIFEK